MDARSLLDAGNLAEALEAATQDVKRAPNNVAMRTFLFELLVLDGQFERAGKQLAVIADQSPEMKDGVASYGAALVAERRRAKLFATGEGELDQVSLAPVDPEPHLTALRHLAAGRQADAAALLEEAESRRVARSGTVDGAAFDDFRDGDDLLAPWLEVISHGRYGWVPIERLAKVELDSPKQLRDLIWLPAGVTFVDGASARVFIPVRYPGSERHADPAVRLGRTVDWTTGAPPVRGVGHRAFIAGDEMFPMLDIRVVTLS